MNYTAEQDLRAALSELAESRSTDAEARLRAVDYRPRTARRHRWPVAGLVATLAAAGAATAVVLLSSAAPEAFAGWSAVPGAATPAAVYATTVACNASHPTTGPLRGTPVLAETRGKYTAALYVKRSTHWDNVCISDGSLGSADVSGGQAILGMDSPPRADQLGMPQDATGWAFGFPGSATRYRGQPSWWSALQRRSPIDKLLRDRTGPGWAQDLVGLAGSGVRTVKFVFDQGVTVNATVEHGWYFAWWPGLALPDSVEVTTASGKTTSSPVPGTNRWNKACSQKGGVQHLSSTSSCGAFATGERPSAIRAEQAWLKAHPHAAASRAARQR
ncbi:MAG TPA: hypothetical protein VHU61_15700 [Solirubrobacteraceae bacterium]|jgi:hypothetical protein|nr:hypothetical protein [Solirubrobacteraceae bacterium]